LPLTYLYESRSGKNTALNTGLPHILGDLVVLTDDDAFARPDWLVQMRQAADSQPSFAIFGGAIVPRWEIDPEEWILKWVPLGPTFTITSPSWVEGPTIPHNVFGPNMAVRAQIFEAGYRFDGSIGPRDSSYPMGSESEFVRRLASNGFKIWHVQKAIVEHFIRKFQMEKSWVLKRAVRFGRGQYRLGRKSEPLGSGAWWGVPRYIFRQMGIQGVRMIKALIRHNEEQLFHARWEFNFLYGQVIEARILYKEAQNRGVDIALQAGGPKAGF